MTAVLHERWRLTGPPESPCGRRLQTTHEGRRLKTVVLSVVGKGATRSRQVRIGKMSDGCDPSALSEARVPSAVDVSKANQVTSKPRSGLCLGINLGDIRLLPRWCPAYRQHEPGPGSRVERVKARLDTAPCPVARGKLRAAESVRGNTEARRAGGLARSSCDPPAYRSGVGSEGAGLSRQLDAINRKEGVA